MRAVDLGIEPIDKTPYQVLGALIGFVILFFIFGFNFRFNEITAYPIICEDNRKDCYTGNPTSYQVHAKGQYVVSKGPIETIKLSNCDIYDVDDWVCTFKDGSGREGFKNGKYFLDPPTDYNIKYVPRTTWLATKYGLNSISKYESFGDAIGYFKLGENLTIIGFTLFVLYLLWRLINYILEKEKKEEKILQKIFMHAIIFVSLLLFVIFVIGLRNYLSNEI